jgi:hypothetical protein
VAAPRHRPGADVRAAGHGIAIDYVVEVTGQERVEPVIGEFGIARKGIGWSLL